ncbi:Ankyrin repeat-containing domain [Trinorchestia longiramus]|nr:Ankyrin repeat-containing domain [Trinorchestia longiramus]
MKDPLSVWLDMFDEDGFNEEPLVPLDIYTAASIGNCASISEALEVNADCLQMCNKGGWTALMYAAYYGHHEAVMLLLSRGASLHNKTPDGLTPLMLAASCGHVETVKGIIKSGGIIEARDNRSWTAIFHAVHSRHCAVLELLLKSGANPMACEPDKGETALQAAIRTSDVDMVSLLLQYGADPTVPDHNGTTPFALASQLRYGNIADAIARAVATRGIVASLPPRRTKLETEENAGCEKDPGTSLEQLLSEAGLQDYLELFEQQAVDLLIFLSLTDADLKECGVSKLGPRRKMTALIARWHKGAPLRSTREAAYADQLSVQLQELQLKNAQLTKDNKAILLKLQQEQELRSSTESLVVEARARLYECHSSCTEAAQHLQHIYNTILQAADYCEHLICRVTWESLAAEAPLAGVGRVWKTGCRAGKEHLVDRGSQWRTVSTVDAKTRGFQLQELHKQVENGSPAIFGEEKWQIRLGEDSKAVEASTANKKFIPIQESMQGISVSRMIGMNSMADVKERPSPTHGNANGALYLMDPKNFASNDCRVTLNFSNNVDNINTFTSATNFFNENNVLPDQNFSSCPQSERNTNVPSPVCDVFSTEKICIPADYRERPPALCIPKLGGPVKECLELLRCSVAMSDPNIPRALTSTSSPGCGHEAAAGDRQHPDGPKVLENGMNFSRHLCDKLNVIEQSKGSRSYFEQLRLAAEPTSTAASSAVYPEAFSSGDSQFTSSNEHNPTVAVVTRDAVRDAALAKLFQRTSISGIVENT